MAEKHVQRAIFKELGGRPDIRLFRNNVGFAFMPDGTGVRYGVCNPGGADLIGLRSITITPEMIGRTVAVFTGIETKGPKGRASVPQKNFISMINSMGGLGGVSKSVLEAQKIIDPEWIKI